MNKKREGFGVLTASLYLCTQNEESAISLSRRSIPGGGHLGLNVRVYKVAASGWFHTSTDLCSTLYHCLRHAAGVLSLARHPLDG